METIVISGGTGLVGRSLTKMLLRHNYHVIILTRDPAKAVAHGGFGNQVSYAAWDVAAQTIDRDAIQKANAIIHLAGAGVVDKRWTPSYKKEIVESRTKSSALLLKALAETPNHVTSFISASAIGWYGADTDAAVTQGFTEDAAADTGFLGETCRLWEASVLPVETLGIRRVVLRTGIVLSKNGGAFVEFQNPVRVGVAAILGNGKQIVSWIHIEDLCNMYLFALQQKQLAGIYNAVAPAPVSNRQLTVTLAKSMKGSKYVTMHVPPFVLKLMLGESSVEVLKSATVSATKIEMAGYQFRFPAIEAAINDLVKK